MDLLNHECKKIPNNRFQNCPALMADSRTFTDYRSSCYVNTVLQNKNNITSSEDYRRFLVQNTDKILQNTKEYFNHKAGC